VDPLVRDDVGTAFTPAVPPEAMLSNSPTAASIASMLELP
jgi:hypothetical protein